VISKLSCSLVGTTQMIKIIPGTISHLAYGEEEVDEPFRCNYGLNPAYRGAIGKSELKIAGVDSEGEARIVEQSGHRFYIATLFLPQLSSTQNNPHPLIMAFIQAALDFQTVKR
jgi:CTP synthase (UTP-ammonia lyase)